MKTTTIINLNFKIVFQPYDKSKFNNRRRFLVGANSLHYYITKENAETAFNRALNSKGDKIRIKFRAHGIVDFYTK